MDSEQAVSPAGANPEPAFNCGAPIAQTRVEALSEIHRDPINLLGQTGPVSRADEHQHVVARDFVTAAHLMPCIEVAAHRERLVRLVVEQPALPCCNAARDNDRKRRSRGQDRPAGSSPSGWRTGSSSRSSHTHVPQSSRVDDLCPPEFGTAALVSIKNVADGVAKPQSAFTRKRPYSPLPTRCVTTKPSVVRNDKLDG